MRGAPRGTATNIQCGAISIPKHQTRIGIIAIEHHRKLIESDASVAITHSPSEGTCHWVGRVS
jgi:hypothetical protein